MTSTDPRLDFVSLLNDARLREHLSIRATAKIAGVPSATAHGWLRGTHLPTPALRPHYLRLVEHLGLAEELPLGFWDVAPPALAPALRTGTAPYLGLRPFGVADAASFFGRATESRRLADRIFEQRTSVGSGLIMLVGPSGSGKSSLLAAGLIAGECADGVLAGWKVAAMSAFSLDGCPPGCDLAVVDQFEDVLWLDEAEREPVMCALAELAVRTVVVVALRSDAFAAAAAEPVLVEALSRPVLLQPLTRDDLREVVIGPADLAGVSVDDDLTRVLLEDLAPGAASRTVAPDVLPLLSTALLATWAAGSGTRMTVADYLAAGGVSQAVESMAEQAYGSLDDAEQSVTEKLFLRLVRVAADVVVREPMPLAGMDAAARAVMDTFIAARMLTVTDDVVRISHDALLDHWARLHGWVESRRSELLAVERVRSAAGLWESSGRRPETLIPVDQLALGEGMQDRTLLTSSERDYLDASEARLVSVLDTERKVNARLRRRGRAALTLSAVAVAFAVLAGGLYLREASLQDAADVARVDALAARNQAFSRQVATTARSVRSKDPNLLAQMAVEAADVADTQEGVSALLDATAVDMPTQWPGAPSAVMTVSPDEHLVARAEGSGRVTLWRDAEINNTVGHSFQASSAGQSLFAVALAHTAGRDLLAVGGADVRSLWDVTNEPTLVTELPTGGLTTYAAAFTPDGSRVLFGTQAGEIISHVIGTAATTSLWLAETTPGDTKSRPAVSSVAVDPAGVAYVGGATGSLARWQLASSTRLPDLPTNYASDGTSAHPVRVLSVAVSPDGSRLAAGIAGRAVLRWSLGRTKTTPLAPITAFDSHVNGIGFSHDGARLAAASSDQDVTVFDAETGAGLRRMVTPAIATSAGFLADRPIATGVDGTLRLWTAESPTWRQRGSTIYNMSGVGEWLAGGSASDGIELWRTGPGVAQHLPTPQVGTLPDGDSQSGTALVAPNSAWLAGGTAHGRILTWPLTTSGAGPVTVTETHLGNYIATLAVSPDSTILAAPGYQGQQTAILRADPATGKPSLIANIDTPLPQIASFTTNSLLAVALAANRVDLWSMTDPTHPTRVGTIEGLGSAATAVIAAPNSPLIAVGEQSGRVSLWDVTDPATPKQTRNFSDPHSDMYSVAFSPDEKLLIGASGDDYVWGWDLTSDSTAAKFALDGALGRPWDARFIDNGKRFAVAGDTGELKVWLTSPDDARARICTTRGATLTPDDWARYLPGIEPHDPC